MAEPNGKPLPTIMVSWDASNQTAMLNFDQGEFKTWDFVVAVLDMAKSQAEAMKRTAQVHAMQQQAQQAMQDQAIKRTLKLG